MMKTQQITPCLWFDSQAEQAAKFYVSLFKNSKILDTVYYSTETPSHKKIGSVLTITYQINGQKFMALNGGPIFKPNPSISFVVETDEKQVDKLWKKLSQNGKVLMPLQKYPFSKKYGWVQDRFGISWQISVVMNKAGMYPSLMFTGKNFGRCEEAIHFYTKVFKKSKAEFIARYEKGEHDKEGAVKWSMFNLSGKKFAAMESSFGHKFGFNEATSLIVSCKTQKEIDYYWNKMSAVKSSEQCGWLKDKFGVSWQITPIGLDKMIKDKKKGKQVMDALLKMHKLDIKKLKQAYNQ
jgi:predicted 3-demethylubiquinone-9 3-methyltransferase (glyoxalase superfamily)